jgi:dihydrofolate reductase
MRKLIEATLVSLDGVVGSPEEWALPRWDEENKEFAHAQLADVDAFLLGRVTYEKFAAAWSQVTGDPYLDTINRLPKFVASASLREPAWNATPITGDVAAEVARLKNQSGKTIMKYGTGQLDGTLISHGLIDEFHFSVFPVAVGSGLRLFEGIDISGLALTLTGTKTFANGVRPVELRPRWCSAIRIAASKGMIIVPIPSSALVLSGGGNAGAAWMAGIISGLQQQGVGLGDADLIVGTSAGARVGAQLATAGMPGRGHLPPVWHARGHGVRHAPAVRGRLDADHRRSPGPAGGREADRGYGAARRAARVRR